MDEADQHTPMKLIPTRMPQDLIDQLNEKAVELGTNRSALMRDLLERGLTTV